MAQKNNWEKEYRNPLFVTKGNKPQGDVLRFLKFLRGEAGLELSGLSVLDLGCGTGRNANYLAELGLKAVGMEISPTALDMARVRAKEMGAEVSFFERSIGEAYPFGDGSFDLALDVTSSNALSEKERETYLEETRRVLKSGGWLFVRALCKDGDGNAKKLLKSFPGPEYDTYVMPRSGLIERVFSEQDFRALYGKHFRLAKLMKKSGYTNFDGQPYRRNYWLAYLEKE